MKQKKMSFFSGGNIMKRFLLLAMMALAIGTGSAWGGGDDLISNWSFEMDLSLVPNPGVPSSILMV